MKKIIDCKTSLKTGCILLLLLSFQDVVSAQTEQKLTIAECYEMAKANYPAIRKLDLIEKTKEFDIENANKKYLPQVSFSGQATYQSQTISFSDALGSLPVPILPAISKDQYKIQGEVNQVIYDGGSTRYQKELIKANATLQEQNLEASLYSIKQRINNIYFGILLIDAQLKQNGLTRSNLQTQLEKAQAALTNGVAFRSDVDELNAEVVNTGMTGIEYESNRKGYLNMLSLFIGKPLPASTQLEWPQTDTAGTANNRPELKAFDLQSVIYTIQEKQLKTDRLPQVSAFFQGAYGRPTLNIIENKFGGWFITGVKFTWALGSLYTLQNKKKILGLNRQSVNADKETFLFNSKIDVTQQDEQVKKYNELINQDNKVIALRQSVAASAKAQLNNGVITTHEYIQKENEERLARQTLILHQVQLLQAIYNQKFITGN